jgi:hypothetical protein
MSLRFADLARNDPDATVRFAEQELDAGTMTPELARMLLLLQDDERAYAAGIARMVERRLAEAKPVGPYRSTR